MRSGFRWRAMASSLGVIAAVWTGCVSAVPRVDAGLLRVAREAQLDADSERLQVGYEAYRKRCAGCHQLVPPGDQATDVWPRLVDEHRDRLDLTDTEAAHILLYLQAGRLALEQRLAPVTGD